MLYPQFPQTASFFFIPLPAFHNGIFSTKCNPNPHNILNSGIQKFRIVLLLFYLLQRLLCQTFQADIRFFRIFEFKNES